MLLAHTGSEGQTVGFQQRSCVLDLQAVSFQWCGRVWRVLIPQAEASGGDFLIDLAKFSGFLAVRDHAIRYNVLIMIKDYIGYPC